MANDFDRGRLLVDQLQVLAKSGYTCRSTDLESGDVEELQWADPSTVTCFPNSLCWWRTTAHECPVSDLAPSRTLRYSTSSWISFSAPPKAPPPIRIAPGTE
jgi:hypothetical protein